MRVECRSSQPLQCAIPSAIRTAASAESSAGDEGTHGLLTVAAADPAVSTWKRARRPVPSRRRKTRTAGAASGTGRGNAQAYSSWRRTQNCGVASLLVPPLRRQVDVVVRRVQQVDAARVGRVGVEDRAVGVLREDADALRSASAGRVAAVVVDRRVLLVESEPDAVVMVEVIGERTRPSGSSSPSASGRRAACPAGPSRRRPASCRAPRGGRRWGRSCPPRTSSADSLRPARART